MWALARAHWRQLLPALALVITVLSLSIAGVIYLIEKGWFLWWCLGSAALGLIAITILRMRQTSAPHIAASDVLEPDIAWTTLERAAWDDVERLANDVARNAPTDLEQIKALGENVILTVAKRLHPGHEFASARFTVPDLLLALETGVRDARRKIVQRVPGSDVIRVSDLQTLGAFYERYGLTIKAFWYAYRAFRAFANPMQALIQEGRGWLEGEAIGGTWVQVKGQFWKNVVLDIGRAAIDLYGGRLRATRQELEAALLEKAPVVSAPLPVRIVVAGQVNAGKSSLVNALLGDMHAAVSELPVTSGVAEYRIQSPGRPDLVLVDTPGLDGSAKAMEIITKAIEDADIVLWAVSAANPARGIDKDALAALCEHAASRPSRPPPNLLFVATHVDWLPPRREWSPPYDVEAPRSDKARNIKSALGQVKGELAPYVEVGVPVSLRQGSAPYNLEAVWVSLCLLLPEARQVALRRALEDRPGFSLRKAAWQVWEGGRFTGRLALNAALDRLR